MTKSAFYDDSDMLDIETDEILDRIASGGSRVGIGTFSGPSGKRAARPARLTPVPVGCPLCGHQVSMPTLDMMVNHYSIPPQEAAILRAIWRGKGMPVSTERIFDAMYADDINGGPSPQKMYAAFKVALFHLREKLEGSGVSIDSGGYRRGFKLTYSHAVAHA